MMIRPTDRDRAEWLADRADLWGARSREAWITACLEIIARAREEGRSEMQMEHDEVCAHLAEYEAKLRECREQLAKCTRATPGQTRGS